jgi:hypothetical protein
MMSERSTTYSFDPKRYRSLEKTGMRDPDLKKDQRFWKTILIAFYAFSFLQLLSGTYLFFEKIGWHPADIVEYYHGSEAMLAHFPDRPDRFKNRASWEGRLETVFAHAIAYSVLVLGLTHLLRSSVRGGTKRRRLYDVLARIFFCAAAFDLMLDFLILVTPWWMAILKLPAFLLFVSSGFLTVLLLFLQLSGDDSFSEKFQKED